MVLIDQVPPLPPPPPPIATTVASNAGDGAAAAVVGVPAGKVAVAASVGGGDASVGVPVAPQTNRTAFLGAHLGVQCTPLEAFVSTDPSDYAYGKAMERTKLGFFFLFFFHRAIASERASKRKKRKEIEKKKLKQRGRKTKQQRFRVEARPLLFANPSALLRQSDTSQGAASGIGDRKRDPSAVFRVPNRSLDSNVFAKKKKHVGDLFFSLARCSASFFFLREKSASQFVPREKHSAPETRPSLGPIFLSDRS